MTDFSNSTVEQICDDFQYGKSGFDSILKTAVEELKEEADKAKDNAKKQHKRFSQFNETRALSDELTSWLKEFGDKISQGFNESSSKTLSEMAPVFADVCNAAMEMNPANTKEIKKVLDRIINDYEKKSQPNMKVYEAFHKMYTTAFRSTGNMDNAKAANHVSDKMDILQGNGTPDKYLARMAEKPTLENLEAFKMSWKYELENNPERLSQKIKPYAKLTSNIPDIAIQKHIYAYITISLKNALEKEAQDFPDRKDEITQNMISVLDIEEWAGLKEQADKYRSPFEMEMLKERRKRDNYIRVYKLLNIQSTRLRVKADSSRKFYPTKKEMKKAVNILDQFNKIEYPLILKFLGKLDTEKFTNVDDAILDNLNKNLSKLPKESKVERDTVKETEEKLTQIRTQMHSHIVKQKTPAPHGVITEERNDKANNKGSKAPKTTNVFDIKDIKDINGIVK